MGTRPELAQRLRPTLAALAAGILLGTAIFILPEAFAGHELAPLATLAGFFTLFVFGRFARRPEGRAFAAFFAIAAHSTIDGMEYGLLFATSPTAGILGSIGLIIHEFSEGIVLFLILRGARVSTPLAATLALFGAAVTTPVGTIATLTLLSDITSGELSLALGFAAGALLFVGASQLPEEFGDLDFRSSVFAYATGAVFAILMMWTTHMNHDHGGHDHDGDHKPGEHRDH
ncbi:ZIP family metal transporter [Parvularcula mediterranea]|uniref:ZIP family metal transporter n=1 Tax=Parvularcula mediterranea TaxID=2732508 RepID=UPI0015641910|nr:ZIP family metal transporter [Parvularcula mediterranea]